jgi:hypothetical protein
LTTVLFSIYNRISPFPLIIFIFYFLIYPLGGVRRREEEKGRGRRKEKR